MVPKNEATEEPLADSPTSVLEDECLCCVVAVECGVGLLIKYPDPLFLCLFQLGCFVLMFFIDMVLCLQ
ncbi:hypothetical protein Hanom_Chr13g01210151 [Helianthus anomalus]